MNPVTLVLVIVAIPIAFRAGSRWRHHARTWADHKGAKDATKGLRKLRWVTLKAAVAALGVTFVFLVATGAITFAVPIAKHKPAVTPVSPSPHPASPTPTPRTHRR